MTAISGNFADLRSLRSREIWRASSKEASCSTAQAQAQQAAQARDGHAEGDEAGETPQQTFTVAVGRGRSSNGFDTARLGYRQFPAEDDDTFRPAEATEEDCLATMEPECACNDTLDPACRYHKYATIRRLLAGDIDPREAAEALNSAAVAAEVQHQIAVEGTLLAAHNASDGITSDAVDAAVANDTAAGGSLEEDLDANTIPFGEASEHQAELLSKLEKAMDNMLYQRDN